MQTIYQAANGVEAQMILDLLERSGIAAETSGDYLQGGVGELAADNPVRVMVQDAQAAQAKTIITEWEAAEPAPEPAPQSRSSGLVTGVLIGAIAATLVLGWLFWTPIGVSEIDLDRDGIPDQFLHYRGDYVHRIDTDRNRDRKIDMQTLYGPRHSAEEIRLDDDFDGRFETQLTLENGNFSRAETDRDGNGHAEIIETYEQGVLVRVDYLKAFSNTIIKTMSYQEGRPESAELDTNADGVPDTFVRYDWRGEEISRVSSTSLAPADPEPQQALDLSPPDYLDFDAAPAPEPPATDFDAGGLFEPAEETQRVTGSVTPLITDSDDPDKLVELDGGKVSIEVKTE